MVFLRELDYVFQHLHQLGEEIVSVVYCGEKAWCGIFGRARLRLSSFASAREEIVSVVYCGEKP